MALGNWSEAGVALAANGTATRGHHWRLTETPLCAYTLSVYKDTVRMEVTDMAGNALVYGPSLERGEMRFAGVRILAQSLTVGERLGVALLAWREGASDAALMAAVSVEGYSNTGGTWLGCDALVADVALGWMAGEMAARDPERWPALRAAMVEAMAATTKPARPR